MKVSAPRWGRWWVAAMAALVGACGGAGGGGGDSASRYVPSAFGGVPHLYASVLADVDGDGDLDLITHRSGDATESVLLNDGQGHFSVLAGAFGSSHYLGTGGDTVALHAVDVDGDADQDILAIVVDHRYTQSRLQMWINDGHGHFSDASDRWPNQGYFTQWAEWVRVGDLNGDGHPDSMLSSAGASCSPTCSGVIYLNDGTGHFAVATGLMLDLGSGYASAPTGRVTRGGSVAAYQLADLNGDGLLDVLSVDEDTAFLNESSGGVLRFRAVSTGAMMSGMRGTMVDYDGDGLPDFVGSAGISGTNGVSVPIQAWRNLGAGRFQLDLAAIPAGVGLEHARQWLVLDVNRDGRPDLYVADHGYDATPFPGQPNTLLINLGGGVFADGSARMSRKSTFTHGAAAGDVNGDGYPDLFENNANDLASGGGAAADHMLFLNQAGSSFVGVD